MNNIIELFCSLSRSEIVAAVLSGVLVFIISQYFLEMILRPRQKLKDSYANMSRIMLRYQSKFYNSSLTDLERDEIRKASTELLSNAWIVYRNKGKRTTFLEISKLINYIIAQNSSSKTDYVLVDKYLKDIETLNKNIITTYQSLK